MPPKPPKPPKGLKVSGSALWSAVLDEYVLDEHETTILREACRTADSLDGLQEVLDVEGLTSESSQGVRVHPALVELRQQRVTFARLLTALRIPTGETQGRAQGRGAPRVCTASGVCRETTPTEGRRMRRRPKPSDAVPPELATFTEGDWPGRSWNDRYGFWKAARRVWHERHGWPGGPLALIRGQRDVRRRHEGLPLESWARTSAELDRAP